MKRLAGAFESMAPVPAILIKYKALLAVGGGYYVLLQRLAGMVGFIL